MVVSGVGLKNSRLVLHYVMVKLASQHNATNVRRLRLSDTVSCVGFSKAARQLLCDSTHLQNSLVVGVVYDSFSGEDVQYLVTYPFVHSS